MPSKSPHQENRLYDNTSKVLRALSEADSRKTLIADAKSEAMTCLEVMEN
jgi:hypothetical protein